MQPPAALPSANTTEERAKRRARSVQGMYCTVRRGLVECKSVLDCVIGSEKGWLIWCSESVSSCSEKG